MDKAFNHTCEHSSTHGAVSITHVSTAVPTLGTLAELTRKGDKRALGK